MKPESFNPEVFYPESTNSFFEQWAT